MFANNRGTMYAISRQETDRRRRALHVDKKLPLNRPSYCHKNVYGAICCRVEAMEMCDCLYCTRVHCYLVWNPQTVYMFADQSHKHCSLSTTRAAGRNHTFQCTGNETAQEATTTRSPHASLFIGVSQVCDRTEVALNFMGEGLIKTPDPVVFILALYCQRQTDRQVNGKHFSPEQT